MPRDAALAQPGGVGERSHVPPKFLAYLVGLCFKTRCPKLNLLLT